MSTNLNEDSLTNDVSDTSIQYRLPSWIPQEQLLQIQDVSFTVDEWDKFLNSTRNPSDKHSDKQSDKQLDKQSDNQTMTYDTIHTHFMKQQPIVIRHSGLYSSIVQKWSIEYFNQMCASHTKFRVFSSNSNFMFSDDSLNTGRFQFQSHVNSQEMSFQQFYNRIRQTPKQTESRNADSCQASNPTDTKYIVSSSTSLSNNTTTSESSHTDTGCIPASSSYNTTIIEPKHTDTKYRVSSSTSFSSNTIKTNHTYTKDTSTSSSHNTTTSESRTGDTKRRVSSSSSGCSETSIYDHHSQNDCDSLDVVSEGTYDSRLEADDYTFDKDAEPDNTLSDELIKQFQKDGYSIEQLEALREAVQNAQQDTTQDRQTFDSCIANYNSNVPLQSSTQYIHNNVNKRLKYYLHYKIHDHIIPELHDEFDKIPWHLLHQIGQKYNWKSSIMNVLMVSEQACVTTFHFDEQENIFAQINGTKLCILASPYYYTNLYPYPQCHAADRQSQVDIYKPSFSQFPGLSDVQFYYTILQPGDVLYIPSLWWHHIESLTESISLASWFPQRKYDMAIPLSLKDGRQLVTFARNLEKLIYSVHGAQIGACLLYKLDTKSNNLSQFVSNFESSSWTSEEQDICQLIVNAAQEILPAESIQQFIFNIVKNRFRH